MIEGGQAEGCPWDREKGGNWPGSFYRTFSRAILEPVSLFRDVAFGHGMPRPFIYAMIINYILFVVAIAYQAGFQILAMSMELGKCVGCNIFPVAVSIPFAIIGIVLLLVVGVPLITAFMILVRAGLYHLCLMILGAAKRDFQTTFRTVCYATSPQLFQVVPILGGIVAWIWQIVLDVIGLKVVHETTYGRSALAVFLPTIVCCGAFFLLVTMIAGGVFAAIIGGAG